MDSPAIIRDPFLGRHRRRYFGTAGGPTVRGYTARAASRRALRASRPRPLLDRWERARELETARRRDAVWI